MGERQVLLAEIAAEERVPETAADEVALFRSLFRGRTDLFSRRWQNPRTGKSGYAPGCANEWVRGVCETSRVRCGECPHQPFLPVTDAEIRGHLQSRHVPGLYPLLEDEPCWLLAVDFDEASWEEDVRRAGASVAGSRCRSSARPEITGILTTPSFHTPTRGATSRAWSESRGRRSRRSRRMRPGRGA
jgi:hypothetical protein